MYTLDTMAIAREILAEFPDIPKDKVRKCVQVALNKRNKSRAEYLKDWKDRNRLKVRAYNKKWMANKRKEQADGPRHKEHSDAGA